MANRITSTIKGAKEAMDNYYAAVSGDVKRWMMPRKVNRMKVMQLLNKLPTTIMGNKNTKMAYAKIKELVDNNNYSGAKDYVRSQLDKIGEQTAGTMSAAWVREQRRKIK